MRKTRHPYPKEFKEQIVAFHRAGRTPAEPAKEFEPTEESIRLHRKSRQLRIEREIL